MTIAEQIEELDRIICENTQILLLLMEQINRNLQTLKN